MSAMWSALGRRSWLLAGLVCIGLGASTAVAMQSGASTGGSASRASGPVAPRPPAPQGRLKPAAVTPDVMATNAECGEVVTASLTLNGDLFCGGAGTALTIINNSVVLNLGGHRIDGLTTGNLGVSVQGKSDTVEDGVISNFYPGGIEIQGISDTVSAVRSVENSQGIADIGTTDKITNSVAIGGSQYGIAIFGTGGTYSGNHELNSTYGLVLAQSTKSTVTSNVADGNTIYGIWDSNSVGATLTKNTADFNGNDGILVSGDPTVVDGGGNLAKGNDYSAGTTPVECNGVVCT